MVEEKPNFLIRLLDKYADKEHKLEKYQAVGILLLVFVFAGCAGWIWEFLVKIVAKEFDGVYVTGGNLLPWINMYAYGAIVILLVTWKLKRKPLVVFGVSAVATGLLELVSGWAIYVIGNGTRYWDYTNEWYAVGNIGGFVCPASAIAFGLGALALTYGLVPLCVRVSRKMSKRAFLALSVVLFSVIVADDVVNLALRWSGQPSAMDLYHSFGFKFF